LSPSHALIKKKFASPILTLMARRGTSAEVKIGKQPDQTQKFIDLRRNSLAEFLPISQE
jgi:hypothetical protein